MAHHSTRYICGVEFRSATEGTPARIGVLPGSFNPPTIAHRELACAALQHVDQVVCVLPRKFPHKKYWGAALDQRIAMLETMNLGQVAIADGGLYIEIARECRAHFGGSPEIWIVCGTDAADRILTWDYGRPGVAEEMLEEFRLMVAPRSGRHFNPPARYRDRVRQLALSDEFQIVSSTEVRDRIRLGAPWEHLVPPEIVEHVREIYS